MINLFLDNKILFCWGCDGKAMEKYYFIIKVKKLGGTVLKI